MHNDHPPELSIIVPLLNEAGELPMLFDTLAAQEGVKFELILCDGGSVDGTQGLAAERASASPFAVRSIDTPRGRGRQMNAGATIAGADLLLFLHADSRFTDRSALFNAVSAFKSTPVDSGNSNVAARFALRFRRSGNSPSLAYRFYESKARLNRSDCIRGDQGFLLPRRFFEQLGGFDESMPFLEDIRLVESIASKGQWRMLPAEISTSARRFEQEGLLERQVVNAIIVNNIVTGWGEFFSALPGLYHCHADTGRLVLFPLLDGIRRLIAGHDSAWQRDFWQGTGRHVASNAWQLFFWLDARRAFRAGKTEVETRSLEFYLARLQPLFQTPCAAWLARVAVQVWFRWMLIKGNLTKTTRTD